MIIYAKNKEPHIDKIVIRFVKVFEEKNKWHLHSNKWNQLKSSVVFQNIQCMHAELLELYSNKQPRILVSLRVIMMPRLRELNLKNNKIESIQCLRDLHCPELRVLNLADNHLTQVVRALNKAYFPNLESLILCNIFFTKMQITLSRCRLRTFNSLSISIYIMKKKVSQDKGQQKQQQSKGKGLKSLILGLNYISNMRWLNKISHDDGMEMISLENNKAKQSIRSIKQWKINSQKLLL